MARGESGMSSWIKVTVVLHSLEPPRFGLRHSYSNALIAVYKAISGSVFDHPNRLWHFPLSSRTEVLKRVRGVAGTEIEDLPPFVETLLASIKKNDSDALAEQEMKDEISLRMESVPEDLMSTLYQFQVNCLRFAIKKKGKLLLGDEMGLGKTLQALAVACAYREDWPVLVVAPSSLKDNWRNEAMKWVPGLTKETIQIVRDAKEGVRDCAQLVIVSYDLATRMVDKSLLWKRQFEIVIADESHYLKSVDAKRSQAVVPLMQKASRAICVTGTPALSRPAELFMQLKALMPHVFRTFHPFAVRYCAAFQGPFGLDVTGSSNSAELKMILEAAIMVRRLKEEVLSDMLPDKDRQIVDVPCDAEVMKEVAELMEQKETIKASLGSVADDAEMGRLLGQIKSLTTKLYIESGRAKIQGVLDHLRGMLTEELPAEGHPPGGGVSPNRTGGAGGAPTAGGTAAAAAVGGGKSVTPPLPRGKGPGGLWGNVSVDGGGEGGGAGGGEWACSRCTYHNPASQRECDLCDTPRSVVAAAPGAKQARSSSEGGGVTCGSRKSGCSGGSGAGQGRAENGKGDDDDDDDDDDAWIVDSDESGGGGDGGGSSGKKIGGRKRRLVKAEEEDNEPVAVDSGSDDGDGSGGRGRGGRKRGRGDAAAAAAAAAGRSNGRAARKRRTVGADSDDDDDTPGEEEEEVEVLPVPVPGKGRRSVGRIRLRKRTTGGGGRGGGRYGDDVSSDESLDSSGDDDDGDDDFILTKKRGKLPAKGLLSSGGNGKVKGRGVPGEAIGKRGRGARGGSGQAKGTCVAAAAAAAGASSASKAKEPRKLVVFAHHKEVMDALERGLDEIGVCSVRIDGSTAQKKRQPIVDRFQGSASVSVILLSITAAGVGITLTAASCAVFAELYWTPGSMAQAEDRIHRIGQKAKTVLIRYLVGRGTMDDGMISTIHRKQTTLRSTVGLNRDAGGYSNVPGREHRLLSPGNTPSPVPPPAMPVPMLYRPERSQRKLEFAPAAPSEQQRSATAAATATAAAAGADSTTASWPPPPPEGNGASSSLSPDRLQQGVDCVDLSGSPTREGGRPSSPSPHRLDGGDGGGVGGGGVSPYLPTAKAAGPAAATASSGPSLPQQASPRIEASPTSSIPPPSPSAAAAAAAMPLSSGGETNASAVKTAAGGGGAGTSQQSGSQPLSAGSRREGRQATAVGGDGAAKAMTALSAQVQERIARNKAMALERLAQRKKQKQGEQQQQQQQQQQQHNHRRGPNPQSLSQGSSDGNKSCGRSPYSRQQQDRSPRENAPRQQTWKEQRAPNRQKQQQQQQPRPERQRTPQQQARWQHQQSVWKQHREFHRSRRGGRDAVGSGRGAGGDHGFCAGGVARYVGGDGGGGGGVWSDSGGGGSETRVGASAGDETTATPKRPTATRRSAD